MGESSRDKGRRAAVDVGTNSVRLLVVDEDGEKLAREMTITRLGKGVDRNGRLDDEALEKTLQTISRYRDRWRELDAKAVRIAATSAVRDASDRDRFFEGVRDITGVDAEVLSGEEEARLTFIGVSCGLDVQPPVAVLDIGGGSTEVIVGDGRGRYVASISLQLGCVRLTERLLSSDPPTSEELAAAREEIHDQLDHAARCLAEQGADPGRCASLVGVAGTITTLAAMHLDLDRYEAEKIHGTVVPRAVVEILANVLTSMTSEQRRELGPMDPGREDVIAAGALIAAGFLHRFGFGEIVASEADILDGLVRTA